MPADVILVIRRLFDLYANIRPLRAYPNTNSLHNDIDLVVVRENTEDLYLGWEFWSDDETVISLRRTSKKPSKGYLIRLQTGRIEKQAEKSQFSSQGKCIERK